MGRKSNAAEKRSQIVTAFCDCVIDLGLDKATMGEVAARVGMDRSTMHYYFRTREELVAEATQHITHFYVERIESIVAKLSPADRAQQLVELLFGPTFHQPRQSILLDELTTLGNRDAFFQDQVAGFYRRIEAIVTQVIDESFRDRPAKDRRLIAYAISQLSEGTTVFMSLGFDKSRRLAARQAALMMLKQLAPDDRQA